MMTVSEQINRPISSDSMHNRNCYAYLAQLKLFVDKQILEFLPGLDALIALSDHYNHQFPYGDLYSFTIKYIEDEIDHIYSTLNEAQTKALDQLIFGIYHNNNHILENAEWLNELEAQTKPNSINISKKISSKLKNPDIRINKYSPKESGSIFGRLMSLFNPDFKPQTHTNLPSLKNYSYKFSTDPVEYRFSTQAQRHKGEVRISPLFKRWLEINARNSPHEQPICHVYFNNLGLDRSELDIAGSKERDLSLALHKMEQDPSLKIAVITLPAHQSLMSSDYYQCTTDKLAYDDVFHELLEVAEGSPHKSGITDFNISPKTRGLLFKNSTAQSEQLAELLRESFSMMGFTQGDHLSTAQKQAVWFYFTKFALTNYILNTLNPKSFNFSCKDAIDRGAVSSLFFNLLKSIELDKPIPRDEFEIALDIAAANVKGRGMNFHRKIMWNALDCLINAHYDDMIYSQNKSWLIFWRDMNCPHSRVDALLKSRILQCKQQLNNLPESQNKLKEIGLKLLSTIDEHYQNNVSGQRLLLEAVSRTSHLICNKPDPESIKAYKNIANELQINHPSLYIIGGIMESLLGLILFIPSLGYSRALIFNGFATAKSGFFASQRRQLCEEIIQFSDNCHNTSVA